MFGEFDCTISDLECWHGIWILDILDRLGIMDADDPQADLGHL
jgi:hypothetical protein